MDGQVNAAVRAANILGPAMDLAGQLDHRGRAFLGMAKALADTNPKVIRQAHKTVLKVLAGTDAAGAVRDFQPLKLAKGGLSNVQGHVQSLADQYMEKLKYAHPIDQATQIINTIAPAAHFLPAGSPPRVMTQAAALTLNLASILPPRMLKQWLSQVFN